jgi:hypothetical protein
VAGGRAWGVSSSMASTSRGGREAWQQRPRTSRIPACTLCSRGDGRLAGAGHRAARVGGLGPARSCQFRGRSIHGALIAARPPGRERVASWSRRRPADGQSGTASDGSGRIHVRDVYRVDPHERGPLRVERTGPGRGVVRIVLDRLTTRSMPAHRCPAADLRPPGQGAGRVRAVVLTGDGASFCAGADVNWMRAGLGLTPSRTSRAMARPDVRRDRPVRRIYPRVPPWAAAWAVR